MKNNAEDKQTIIVKNVATIYTSPVNSLWLCSGKCTSI